MTIKKLILSGVISAVVIAGSLNFAFAGNTIYKVQAGDTFWTISQKYDISIQNLMKANNATQYTVLYPGQSLTIPLVNRTVHTVQRGETYWIISQKYGIDFNKLLEINRANGSAVLYPGQEIMIPLESQTIHTVQAGETYWTISQKYGIQLDQLLQINQATGKSVLYVGDSVRIPSSSQTPQFFYHTITSVDSFWTLSKKYNVGFQELMAFNQANENTMLIDGQKVKIPVKSGVVSTPAPTPTPPPTPTKPYITYTNYTVQKGDNLWNLAWEFGLPAQDLMKANHLNESSYLNVGATLKIPVHHIPVKSTPGAKYGELLDWWSEAQYVVPRGATFEVVDFYTGKSFFAKRTAGSNHADCETLTAEETRKMKEIWGGNFSWGRRPVLIKIDGRVIAAGATAMPHAGSDYVAGGVWTDWRSGNYGAGINHDYIKGNGAHGHFDIHFLNSTRHKDGQLDAKHQECVQIAGGSR